MSRMSRFRSTRLISADEFREKIEQRRRDSEDREKRFKTQCTGAYWSYTNGIFQSTGEHAPLDPPFVLTDQPIEEQPTQRLGDPVLSRPKTTEKLAAYHEPCSDSIDISAIQLSNSLKPLILASMQEHGGRLPCEIHLHPLTLLTLASACPDGRYAGIIPLFPDMQLPVNKMHIEYEYI